MKQNTIRAIFIRLEDLNDKIDYNEKKLKLISKLLEQMYKKDSDNDNDAN
jgi:hypothetical protein